MPSSSLFLRSCTTFVSILSLFSTSVLAADKYYPDSTYVGKDFTNNDLWSFYKYNDPTHGFVTYSDKDTSVGDGRITYDNGRFQMRVDTNKTLPTANYDQYKDTNGIGRGSVRIESQKNWNKGLFVADIVHMPEPQCGIWPAWWTLGQRTAWPKSGEIDIIEGVNLNTQALAALHTGYESEMQVSQSLYNGAFQGQPDCNVYNSTGSLVNFAGCAVLDDTSGSFGSKTGRTVAMEWTSQSIKVWSFARNAAPADILAESPDPSKWGKPDQQFTGNKINIDKNFLDHRMIFDTTLCGDWAGDSNVWRDSGCQKSTGETYCADYVAKKPGDFKNSYWDIAKVRVYQKSSQPPTTSSTTTSTTTSSSTTKTSTSSSTTSSTSKSTTSTTSSSSTSKSTTSTTSSSSTSKSTTSTTSSSSTSKSTTSTTSSSSTSKSTTSSATTSSSTTKSTTSSATTSSSTSKSTSSSTTTSSTSKSSSSTSTTSKSTTSSVTTSSSTSKSTTSSWTTSSTSKSTTSSATTSSTSKTTTTSWTTSKSTTSSGTTGSGTTSSTSKSTTSSSTTSKSTTSSATTSSSTSTSKSTTSSSTTAKSTTSSSTTLSTSSTTASTTSASTTTSSSSSSSSSAAPQPTFCLAAVNDTPRLRFERRAGEKHIAFDQDVGKLSDTEIAWFYFDGQGYLRSGQDYVKGDTSNGYLAFSKSSEKPATVPQFQKVGDSFDTGNKSLCKKADLSVFLYEDIKPTACEDFTCNAILGEDPSGTTTTTTTTSAYTTTADDSTTTTTTEDSTTTTTTEESGEGGSSWGQWTTTTTSSAAWNKWDPPKSETTPAFSLWAGWDQGKPKPNRYTTTTITTTYVVPFPSGFKTKTVTITTSYEKSRVPARPTIPMTTYVTTCPSEWGFKGPVTVTIPVTVTVVAGTHGGRPTGGAPIAHDAPHHDSPAATGAGSDPLTWATWNSGSDPVEATAVPSWSGWQPAADPVEATATASWSAWNSGADPVEATATASWSAWSSGVDPEATAASSWTAWNSDADSADATATASWSGWNADGVDASATDADGVAAATGSASPTWSGWDGETETSAGETGPSGIKIYQGAASSVRSVGNVICVVIAGAIAFLML